MVLLENLGNTNLDGVYGGLPGVADLACGSGAANLNDSAIIATAAPLSANNNGTATVAPRTKVVCQCNFTFEQQELDKDQSSRRFEPWVNMSTLGATTDASGLGASGYAEAVIVPIAASARLIVAVNASACIIPSTIPAGANSEFAVCCATSQSGFGPVMCMCDLPVVWPRSSWWGPKSIQARAY